MAHPILQRHAVLPALCLLAAAAPERASASEIFSLTDVAFETRSVTVRSVDAEGVAVTVAASGEEQRVPLSKLVQLTRDVRPDPIKGLVLCMQGGDRLVGQPKGIDGQSLVWFAAGVGEVKLPFEQALGILRDRAADPNLHQDRAADLAKLATGDVVQGITTALDDTTVTLTPGSGGDASSIPVAALDQLLLATPPGGRPERPAATFIVKLITGTVISCRGLRIDGADVTLVPQHGEPAKTQVSQIVSIEHMAGPARWLSMVPPLENVHTPFFAGAFPARFDRTVTGEPIRVNGITYGRGIGVHSRSRLVFPIAATDRVFRTRYAVEPQFSYANVDVRVLIDDKPVHEQAGVRAGTLSDVIRIDIPEGAKSLALEVGYGQGYDVHDRLVWIEPAIIQAE